METVIFGQYEEVISLSHAKVYVFSDPVLCLGKMNQNPTSNSAWEEKLSWFKSSSQYRTLDTMDGEPMEFEWNIFPGFTTLQLCNKVQEFMSKTSDPLEFKGRIIFMSMFNDISWWCEDNEREGSANADLVSKNARRFPAGRWSFLGSEKKWYSTHVDRPQGEWWWNSENADTQFSEPRVHCPEERSKAEEVENYQYTSVLMGETIETVFRTIISVIQLSIYGAVSDLYDEDRICQARTERLVLAEQSDPLFQLASLLMKTPTPSTDDPAQEEDLSQRYQERIEKLSQQDRVI